jgi:PAS domain S-box-containing protein
MDEDKGRSPDELQDELHALHAIMDCLAMPVVIIETNRQVRLMNRAARELLGVGEEAGPLRCHECFHMLNRNCREEIKDIRCPMAEVRKSGNPVTVVHEHHMPDGKVRIHELVASPYLDGEGNFLGIVETIHEVTEKKMLEDEREGLIADLQEALATIKTLRGLIPICAWCNKIRDDKGYWKTVEKYLEDHSEAKFTHGICPECEEKIEGEDG